MARYTLQAAVPSGMAHPQLCVRHLRSGNKRLGADNHDVLQRPVSIVCPCTANLVNDIHTCHHLSEDSVLAVQMRGRCQRDEKLASVGARTAVGHGQDSLASMLERRVEFVFKLAAEDGATTTTGTSRIATLDHEVGDDAVEYNVVVLARISEAGKVLAGLYDYTVSTDIILDHQWIQCTLGVLSENRTMVMSP